MSSARTLPRPEPSLAATSEVLHSDRTEPLPIDRSVEFHPEIYPRNPDDYEPLDHFLQRQNESWRMLRREIGGFSAVRKTIYAGYLTDNKDGCAKFSLDVAGIMYIVLVGYHTDGHRIAVTGWPFCYDEETALESDEWRADEVAAVVQHNEKHERSNERNKFNRFHWV